MVDCDYCDASFDSEDAYLEHLGSAHEGELGSIDRRRVDEYSGGSDDGGSIPTGPAILVGVIGFSLAIVVYVVVFMGGSGGGGGGPATTNGIEVAQTPGELRSAHEHGTMEVRIDGQRLDFSQSQYQVADRKFHFEGGDGRVWHGHASGVTLEYALATLDIRATENSVTYGGTTYTDGENANVSITVDGDPVDPETYVLQGVEADSGANGDRVRIVVESTG